MANYGIYQYRPSTASSGATSALIRMDQKQRELEAQQTQFEAQQTQFEAQQTQYKEEAQRKQEQFESLAKIEKRDKEIEDMITIVGMTKSYDTYLSSMDRLGKLMNFKFDPDKLRKQQKSIQAELHNIINKKNIEPTVAVKMLQNVLVRAGHIENRQTWEQMVNELKASVKDARAMNEAQSNRLGLIKERGEQERQNIELRESLKPPPPRQVSVPSKEKAKKVDDSFPLGESINGSKEPPPIQKINSLSEWNRWVKKTMDLNPGTTRDAAIKALNENGISYSAQKSKQKTIKQIHEKLKEKGFSRKEIKKKIIKLNKELMKIKEANKWIE